MHAWNIPINPLFLRLGLTLIHENPAESNNFCPNQTCYGRAHQKDDYFHLCARGQLSMFFSQYTLYGRNKSIVFPYQEKIESHLLQKWILQKGNEISLCVSLNHNTHIYISTRKKKR